VKNFLTSFNLAVKEKLKEPFRKEVSYEALIQIKDSCSALAAGDSSELMALSLIDEDAAAAFDFL
jgi:hypothetical protein